MESWGFSQEPRVDLVIGIIEIVVIAAAIPKIPVFVGFQAESAV